MIVGVTVTLAAAGGVVPELALHVNGPEPDEVNTALEPKHIMVLEGVMLIDGVGIIETVAIADAVHVPEPDNTV